MLEASSSAASPLNSSCLFSEHQRTNDSKSELDGGFSDKKQTKAKRSSDRETWRMLIAFQKSLKMVRFIFNHVSESVGVCCRRFIEQKQCL